jgi:hypothetical protein
MVVVTVGSLAIGIAYSVPKNASSSLETYSVRF